MNIPLTIAKELNIAEQQVLAVVDLFDDEATVPFIARYRKEKTGGLDEEQLRTIEDRLNYLQLLEDRKTTVLNSIEEQGKLTNELKEKILAAVKLQEVEDLYLPYKPKRKTRGTIAKAKGLEPLALFILENPKFSGDFDEKMAEFVNAEKGVNSTLEALKGAKDIIAEMLSDDAEVRKAVREFLLTESNVNSQKADAKKEEGKKPSKKKDVYEIYHDFKIEITRIKPYQLLALNRGEEEKFLKVSFSYDVEEVLNEAFDSYFGNEESVFEEILIEVTEDSFKRLIYPSLEKEIRNYLTEAADLHAVEVFSSNLRQLLLQPPIAGKMIMGIDPGFVSGSKIAVIDTTGKYIDGDTMYPHPPQKRMAQAKQMVLAFVKKYDVGLIAVGNGTASRETELMVAELIQENNLDCHYLIVSEAGASVYSASVIAKQEFPDLEASQRGNISIARRVLDPLAELVKIDPKSIGVGLYQHDVDQKLLLKNLDDVVVSCVNYVGVDLNTASASLLTYVSGLNKRIANAIVRHREKIGKFKSRKELMDVTGVGEKLFEQAAGFLKIPGGENPLDNTFIHPESYEATEKLLHICNVEPSKISTTGGLVGMYVDKNGLLKVADEIKIGEMTLEDILDNLKKPGRDPREEMPKPILRSDVLKIEHLQVDMKLNGTVRNVVDFGAFVDIGLKHDGLLHISQMGNKYIKNPLEELQVGDIIEVKIIKVDIEKERISLSMKD
ncbi:MAG: RNA-binding transcriptional accessory protein [Melioribacteraceae bacterium]|nr:RNA-binding transcriptional accessory protein [Melioribacteraceae bacterium]